MERGIYVYFAAAAANLLTMAAGWGYAWSSPAVPKLNGAVHPELNPLPLPTTLIQDSWVTSLLHLGSSFGPIIAGQMADRVGRKRTLLAFAIPMALANIITIFARTVEQFYVSRFLTGLGCGAVFAVIPLYVAEISEVHNRGVLSCLLAVLITVSSLLCFCVGPSVEISTMGYIGLAPLLLFLIIYGCFVPESPHYYMMMNDVKSAEQSLMKLRRKSSGSVQKELLEISRGINQDSPNKATFFDLFRSVNSRKALFISIGLMLFQQTCGICGIMSYLQIFFDATGSSLPSDISVMIVGGTQFITVIVTSSLIDRLGRKVLLVISACGLFLSLAGLATYFFLKDMKYNLDSLFWLPVFCVIFYIVSFSFGMGPVPWTILSETFPANVKFHGSSLVTWFCLIFSFVIAMLFPIVSDILGLTICMMTFATCTGILLFFIIFFVPETKGKTFQEIQEMLSRNKKEEVYKKRSR